LQGREPTSRRAAVIGGRVTIPGLPVELPGLPVELLPQRGKDRWDWIFAEARES
jgi:hypothetical protein